MLKQKEALDLVKTDNLDVFHSELSEENHHFRLDFDEVFLLAIEHNSLNCLRFLAMDYACEVHHMHKVLPELLKLNEHLILEDFADSARSAYDYIGQNVDIQIIEHALNTDERLLFKRHFQHLKFNSDHELSSLLDILIKFKTPATLFSEFTELSADAIVSVTCYLDFINSSHLFDFDCWLSQDSRYKIFSSHKNILNNKDDVSWIKSWFNSIILLKNTDIIRNVILSLASKKIVYLDEILDYSFIERLLFIKKLNGPFTNLYSQSDLTYILMSKPFSDEETISILNSYFENNSDNNKISFFESLAISGSKTLESLVRLGEYTSWLLAIEHPYYTNDYSRFHEEVISLHLKYNENNSEIYRVFLNCIEIPEHKGLDLDEISQNLQEHEQNNFYIDNIFNFLSRTGICFSEEEFESRLIESGYNRHEVDARFNPHTMTSLN
ncbi:hypothetical protein GCM10007978_02120 [Shewanella hanedai]|uniref:Uncharacterized protein n=1 Tax=Shewanella hanedai TaxID=25 RepID=A0A553JV24_SHEHA|nr:hypothetical protein [Shewanella hanedai]TRY16317.1 hypothetical protein FN961_01450 [Shewanella hanedai]GGI68009.1 hypothetical protein GCM10007978_02120 [Shewanella hanedai]